MESESTQQAPPTLSKKTRNSAAANAHHGPGRPPGGGHGHGHNTVTANSKGGGGPGPGHHGHHGHNHARKHKTISAAAGQHTAAATAAAAAASKKVDVLRAQTNVIISCFKRDADEHFIINLNKIRAQPNSLPKKIKSNQSLSGPPPDAAAAAAAATSSEYLEDSGTPTPSEKVSRWHRDIFLVSPGEQKGEERKRTISDQYLVGL